MSGARASLAARLDLASLGQESSQAAEVLVVDLFDLVDAELAHLAAWSEFSAGSKFTGSASLSRATAGGGRGSHDHRCGSFLRVAAPPCGQGAERSTKYKRLE